MWLGNLVDGLWRRADSFAHPLEARQGQTGKVLTIVQVITATQPQTFAGSAVLVPVTSSQGSVLVGGAVLGGNSKTTTSKKSSSTADSSNSESSAAPSAAATSSNERSSPSSAAATSPSSQITSAPLVPPASTGAAGSAASSTTSATPQSAKGGMSSGAKAGLAFGILVLIGALLAGVLMLYRRQKNKAAAGERLDDEKAAFSPASPDALPRNPEPALPTPPPQQMAAVSRSQESLAAPRLELRPVTQFDPRMSTMNGVAPGGNQTAALGATAAVAAAGGAAAAAGLTANNTPRTPSPSSWEKRGVQQHANDPANPFGSHAETLNNSPPKEVAVPVTDIPRAPSPGHIDVADFPLPASGAVTPKPISLQFDSSTDTLPSPVPSAPATVSNVSLPVSEIAAAGAAGLVIGGAAAATVVAGRGGNSPPLDNVHRVQLDFKPSMDDELEIRAGQLVRLLHEYDDGWALCTRMDRSQQGVVPRTCLSKHVVKPRPQGPPSGAPQGPSQGRQGPRGPGGSPPQMRGPGPAPYGQPHPLMPGSGRNSPAPYAQVPRPLTPTGRNSPAPYPGGRSMSPAPYAQAPRSQSPAGGPGGRARAQSNASSPYRAYQPGPKGQGRSQSPGPYGAPGMMRPPQRPDNMRRRSNSMSNLAPSNQSSPPPGAGKVPTRKPVPGQAV